MHTEYFRSNRFWFLQKKESNPATVSELKEIFEVYISYYVIHLHFIWFTAVMFWRKCLTQNISDILLGSTTKGFWEIETETGIIGLSVK